MPETVLCEGAIRVSVDGAGDRLLVVVRDGTAIRFWMDTFDLECVLEGELAQLSADGGFLRIEGMGDRVRMEYSLRGDGRQVCEVDASDVSAAIAIVRSERLRRVSNPNVVVEDAS